MIVSERVGAYIDSLERPLPPYLREMEKEATRDGVPIIRKGARSLLRFLLDLHRPMEVLEVGAAIGFSALYMSERLPDGGRITTIEKDPARAKRALENIRRAGRESSVTLLQGDAGDILDDLLAKGRQYPMVFMDAAKGQYLSYLPAALGLLEKGGILVSDNVLQDGDVAESRYAVDRGRRTIHFRMREYLYQLTHLEGLDTVVLPIGDGMTVSAKTGEGALLRKEDVAMERGQVPR